MVVVVVVVVVVAVVTTGLGHNRSNSNVSRNFQRINRHFDPTNNSRKTTEIIAPSSVAVVAAVAVAVANTLGAWS